MQCLSLPSAAPYVAPSAPLPAFVTAGSVASSVAGDTTLSWTDTVPVGCNFVVVWTLFLSTVNSSSAFTGTHGGYGMTKTSNTSLGLFNSAGTLYYQYLTAFTMFDPDTGTPTITVNDVNDNVIGHCQAIYYSGVNSVGTPVTYANPSPDGTTTVSTSMAMSAASTSASLLYAQCFGSCNSAVSDTMSAYSQTKRTSANSADNFNSTIIGGDAFGNAGTLSFSATVSSAPYGNGGIILPLSK